MKQPATHQYRLPTLALLGSLLLATIALFGWATASIIELPFSGIIALATAVSVSAFIGRLQIRLSKGSGVAPVPILFAFWGLIWFGHAGGIILGVLSTILNIWPPREDKKIGVFEVLPMITSIVGAVSLSAFLFDIGANTGARLSGPAISIVGMMTSGCILMTAIYVLMNATLRWAFQRLESKGEPRQTITSRIGEQWLGGTLIGLSTILICLPFSRFGIEFGLVIAPIAILANLAYSIHTKRLDQKTRQISQASRIHLATVEALATAIDARDQVGLGHVQRTQIYAIGLGELLGLGEAEINALRTGALLHDIGKLAVPDHILNKPDKLTAAELEKTKIHSLVGASILEKIDFDCPVVPTVKYHHEFWDGRGYPEGLKGNQIPLTARILAVADAYDTLRGARPYRPALPRDLARQIIQDESGTHFDPSIVRCFLKNLTKLEADIDAHGFAYTAENDHRGENYVAQIKLANREVFTLYELAREFGSSLGFEEILSLFTKKIADFVPFTTCAVFLLDDTRKYATAVHVVGENSAMLSSRRVKVGDGTTGSVLKTKKTVQNGDPALDLASFDDELSEQYATMASVPLVADEELIGVVSIYSAKATAYSDEDLRLLETITRIAAEAIGKSVEHDEAKTHALTDTMTSLPNARSLQIQFEKEAGRASRGGTSFQLLMLDLDGFKAVNDSFGHKTGDNLLREVGKVIREQLRDYDFLARYGGDEFVALVPDMTLEDVAELCGRIEAGVRSYQLEVEDGKYASVGVSVGSSAYPASGETFDQLIVAADKAMYRRKTRRRVDPAKFVISGIDLSQDLPQAYIQHEPENDGLIVELDESHVLTSTAVN
jgi:diguanylate cyclase (GGDEF)-like protein/putative nucleotidyltransferase with HDIG domain